MNRVSPLIKFVVAIAQLNKWLIPLCRKVPEIYIYIYIFRFNQDCSASRKHLNRSFQVASPRKLSQISLFSLMHVQTANYVT